MAAFFEWMSDKWGRLLSNTLIHLEYSLVSVAVGFLLGFFLGVALSRNPKLSKVFVPILSLFNTIPGIVFLGLLFIYVGMKPISAIIALSIYAMFPIMKDTLTGLLEVDAFYKEAAAGCGMSRRQTLWKVEIPLALPSIIGGLRMATIYTVSWATMTAMIGLHGLGEFIFQGVEGNNAKYDLLGAIPCAIMAIILAQLCDRLKKAVTPRGRSNEGGAR